ncbi:22589_t:CDS:2, partial [Racocetra persica]
CLISMPKRREYSKLKEYNKRRKKQVERRQKEGGDFERKVEIEKEGEMR